MGCGIVPHPIFVQRRIDKENKMKERTRLNIDLDELLPGDQFQIGKESVLIRPLSLIQYKVIVGQIKSLWKYLKENKIDENNFQEPENFIFIAETVIEKFPDLLAEVSNIHQDDLQQLPVEIIVALIDKCLEVNMKAKDSLMGNFKSLIGKIDVSGLLQKMPETKIPVENRE